MSDSDDSRMHIGEVAERTGMSLRTLRHYDDIGLLTPSARSDGGFRLYTEDDLTRLLLIRRMKPLGYTLGDMHHVIALLRGDAGDSAGADGPAWAAVLDEARRRRAELARQVDMADEFVALVAERYADPTVTVAERESDGVARDGVSGQGGS